MNVAIALLAVSAFVLFARGARCVFRREAGVALGMRWILLASAAFGVADVLAILAAPAGTARLGAAGLFLVASMALFRWTARTIADAPLELAFGDVQPKRLETRGPYRFVRHPFYSAYLAAWLGGAVATTHPVAVLGVAVLGGTYWVAARGEERRFVEGSLGEEYVKFRRSRGLFLPRLLRA